MRDRASGPSFSVSRAPRAGRAPGTGAAALGLGLLLAAAASLSLPRPSLTQETPGGRDEAGQGAAQEPPPADPADVESIDAIVAALYEAISGPAGEERDADRIRSLFWPGSVLLPIVPDGTPRELGLERWIRGVAEYTRENAFYEREVARTENRYGHIAQVFSTYESRHDPEDPEPFTRGINAIQLVHDGSRWWITQIAWAETASAGPIPERYGGG